MWNRVWLALTGLMLAGAGGMTLARGLGAFGSGFAHGPLVADAMSRWVTRHRWFWPSSAGGACAFGMLGFCWLTAQWRSRTLRRLALGGARCAATRIAARVATRAVAADVMSYPGVRRVRARLFGSARRPRVRLHVMCDAEVDLTELEKRIRDDAMVRLRKTLDREDLGGVVDFRTVP